MIERNAKSVFDALDDAAWSHVHLRIVAALGIAWILDGFETTVTAPVLANVAHELNFGGPAAALVNPIYTMGMLAGALIFRSRIASAAAGSSCLRLRSTRSPRC
jgi:hypothetical protein